MARITTYSIPQYLFQTATLLATSGVERLPALLEERSGLSRLRGPSIRTLLLKRCGLLQPPGTSPHIGEIEKGKHEPAGYVSRGQASYPQSFLPTSTTRVLQEDFPLCNISSESYSYYCQYETHICSSPSINRPPLPPLRGTLIISTNLDHSVFPKRAL